MNHLRQAIRGGVPQKPKHHMFVHLLFRAATNGNPAAYSTFVDESDNRKLAAVCRAAHVAVWEVRIFQNYKNLSVGAEPVVRGRGTKRMSS